MSIQIVGISGSPIPNSNTDRAVQRILEFTGLSTQFVKLSDLICRLAERVWGVWRQTNALSKMTVRH